MLSLRNLNAPRSVTHVLTLVSFRSPSSFLSAHHSHTPSLTSMLCSLYLTRHLCVHKPLKSLIINLPIAPHGRLNAVIRSRSFRPPPAKCPPRCFGMYSAFKFLAAYAHWILPIESTSILQVNFKSWTSGEDQYAARPLLRSEAFARHERATEECDFADCVTSRRPKPCCRV